VRGFNFNAGLLLKYPRLSLGAVVRPALHRRLRPRESDSEVVFDQGKALPAQPSTST